MRTFAKTVRFLFIASLSLLGGAVSAAAYAIYSQGSATVITLWLPMIAGAIVANFAVRCWSFNHPPRFSQEWEDRRSDVEEF